MAAYQALQEDKTQAIALNSTLKIPLPVWMLTTRKIKENLFLQDPSPSGNQGKADANADTFNIYVSGIDTYGPVTSVSRSDVNIIMTVNRKTKQSLADHDSA